MIYDDFQPVNYIVQIVVRVEVEPKTASPEQEILALKQMAERFVSDIRGAKLGAHGERGSFYTHDAHVESVSRV